MRRAALRHRLLCFGLGLALGLPLCAQPLLSGRLFAAASRPLAGARIELIAVLPNYEAGRLRLADGEPQPAAAASSDAGGGYALAAPEPGVWRVVVRAAGRVPMQFGPLLLLEPVELPPLILPADAGLRLQVVEDAGRPAAGAWIFAQPGAGAPSSVRSEDGWRPEFRLGRTAADGALTLPRLEGEPLAATVFLPGRGWQTRAETADGVWKLARDGGVERLVRLVTAAGEGVPNVLIRAGDLAWPQAVSDAEGRVRLRVPAGAPLPLVCVTPQGSQERIVLPAEAAAGQETRIVLNASPRIAGRVLDAATGKPLPGALIGVEDDLGRSARSDQAGRYELVAPGARRFALAVRAPGFLPQRVWTTAAQVRKGRVPTAALHRASRLRGRVLGPGGEPLAGAAVVAVAQAALSDRTFAAEDPVADRVESDAAGSFELRQLGPGAAYELRAARAGYFPAAVRVVAPRPAETVPAARLQLVPARALRGSVQDAAQRPLAGVTLLFRPSRRPGFPIPVAERESAAPATSDGRGSFLLADVPAAEVDLEAVKPGFAPVRRRGIRLSPGPGPFDLGVIVLRPGATLAGKVLGSRGEPLAGSEVFLVASLPPRGLEEDRLRRRQPQALAGADGRFQLADQPAGVPLNLIVLAKDHLPAQVRGVRAPAAPPLTVRLDRAWSLHGRVVSEEGEAVSGATLELRWRDILPEDPDRQAVGPTIVRTASSDREGRFVLRGVPRGQARLDVAAHGFVPAGELEVTVPAADPRRERMIVLKRGAVLEGRVITTDGEPVSGVRIGVRGAGGFSDGDGRYVIEGVPLGPQAIQAFHGDYRTRVERMQIEPGVNLLDFELEAGVEVSGRVLDESGEPVAGADVWLVSRQRSDLPEYHARSAHDGGFRFSPVARGRYTLGAEAEDRARTELAAAVAVAREDVGGLEIALRRGTRLSGRVLGLPADDLAAVEVEARDEDRGPLPARIDAAGRYEIRHLPPGDWQVRASLLEGQRQAEARVPVAAGDREVTRDLEFRPRLTLAGQVLYGEEPLAEARVSLRGERFAIQRETTTDFEGRFRLQDLEPDVYWLGLSKPSQWLVHNATVEMAADRELLIRLEASSVAGRISEAGNGSPIADALLMLHHLAGPEGPEFLVTGSSRGDGAFTLLRVPAGTYRLTVRAEGYSPAVQELRVAAGQHLQGLDLRLNPAQGLRLAVRRASGGVPEIVHVLARSLDGQRAVAETHQPDAAGMVHLATLPAGTWSLAVSGTRAAVATSTVTVPGEPAAVRLPDAARLRVRVPALVTSNLNASLTMIGADRLPFWTLAPGGRPEQQWPLAGGVATVEGLPAGTWLLQVKATDGQSWAGTVTTSGVAEAFVSLE